MGGECNYLLRVSRDSAKRLEFVPDEQWKSRAMMAWSEEAIQGMLSSAESVLRETAHRLRLPITVRGCLQTAPSRWQRGEWLVSATGTVPCVLKRHLIIWVIWSQECPTDLYVRICRRLLTPGFPSLRCLSHAGHHLTGQASSPSHGTAPEVQQFQE